ncbi:conserved hypothetical protein [Alkaliphilus metalliredigens QYMF]|uniref:DUF5610 domain-containing protein n=1 Tax=Alkaliphilus metalliredigens (strain QYMF) TaxID=293826 RepID=A6TLD1_ALKMQ|nr:hypothetical protein [Alkaliphilus metalliredigens]ABR46999.1 conserved hypothetical protein [Alkaliphilus metalliredigens QYMF]
MKINNITNKSQFTTSTVAPKENKQKKSNQASLKIQDEYTPVQNEVKEATYKKPIVKVDESTIQKLKEESESAHNHLREMVKQLLERQGLTFKDLAGLDEGVKIDEETRLEAQAMIAEGGPFSPENVSDRLIAFAKAISGGDKGKIDILRSAIEKGFKEAQEMLGGELPEISHTTYELTMEKLDAWLAE